MAVVEMLMSPVQVSHNYQSDSFIILIYMPLRNGSVARLLSLFSVLHL